MQHIGFLSLKKFQLEFSGLKKTIVLSKMNMNKSLCSPRGEDRRGLSGESDEQSYVMG